MKSFPHFSQPDSKDCGPTCLRIVAKYYGKSFSMQHLRQLSETQRYGSTLLNLSRASEKLGFHSLGAKTSLEKLYEAPLPCILHWNKNHYTVLFKIKKPSTKYVEFHTSDPAHGLLKFNQQDFLKQWVGNNADQHTEGGIVLFLEPTPKFYTDDFKEKDNKLSITFLSKYVLKYKSFIWQLIFGLLAGSLLQLIFPFLTQSVVDVGIKNQDVNFVFLILFAQLFLFLGRTAVEVIRSWILLHLSTRINISLLSDFFIKLMNLPIAFFDTRLTGDILQRINDHQRIERILTTSSLNVLFSMMNLLIFGLVLAYYNLTIFLIFLLGSIMYFGWITIFLKKRADLDYKRFSRISEEQSKVIELISGMQEIKLHNAETEKRWSWEYLQARLFKVAVEGLKLEQYQNVGSSFINELKNILITVLSAKLVIEGEITLGMMLAISYIVGQLNSPISQLINFIRELQDAKISIDRLSEIHNKEDEEETGEEKIHDISSDAGLEIKNLTFRYAGTEAEVLKDLDLVIPPNKVTAIVGVSGSGKTTLMKLFLKFYKPIKGEIKLGSYNLQNVSQRTWRSHCGAVMQEGFIFNDTIVSNVTLTSDHIDKKRLIHALDVANIREFIESLPLSYNTRIGSEGVGVSTGQKQRLLIARAVYKNPDFLFFDEATSSLDANNEKVIMKNLDLFFENKTVIVIAHRLSTVKNAHQIVVLDGGKIVEKGNHKELVALKGHYFNLVKNQLELGN